MRLRNPHPNLLLSPPHESLGSKKEPLPHKVQIPTLLAHWAQPHGLLGSWVTLHLPCTSSILRPGIQHHVVLFKLLLSKGLFFFLIYLFLFIWLCRVLGGARGLLSCGMQAP